MRRATRPRSVARSRASISIHALLAESDQGARPAHHPAQRFQSTLSLRRATSYRGSTYIDGSNFNPRSPCGERLCQTYCRYAAKHFNPRSPCGERRVGTVALPVDELISIHALLAESDAAISGWVCKCGISIHALLAESDHLRALVSELEEDFNPRSPCGERRPRMPGRIRASQGFQSTLSLRRATIQNGRAHPTA